MTGKLTDEVIDEAHDHLAMGVNLRGLSESQKEIVIQCERRQSCAPKRVFEESLPIAALANRLNSSITRLGAHDCRLSHWMTISFWLSGRPRRLTPIARWSCASSVTSSMKSRSICQSSGSSGSRLLTTLYFLLQPPTLRW